MALDSSIAVGDVMQLFVEQVANTGAGTPSAPGWTVRASNTHNTRSGFVLTKARESGETSVTITRAVNAAGRATITALGGVNPDPATWVIGTAKGRSQSPADSSTTTTALSVTTSVANTMVVGFFGEATTAAEAAGFVPAVTGATVWTYAGQSGSSDIETTLVTYREVTSPGASGNAVATYPNTQAQNAWGALIAFPPADTSTAPVSRLAAKAADGAGGILDVGLVGWDGTKEVALSRIEYVHGGTMVPDLDRTDRVWTMGHRGGSLDYQEHSVRGYLECAINHVDVLEFSVGMSSDGVMFGLHDDTLNRTSSSLGSTSVKPSDRTWAQIQALVQDLPNRGDTRFTTQPYLSLDDFVAQWAPSHTLMFDPKLLTAAQRQTLLARIQQIPDYRRRVLGKFYTTGVDRADEFHSIGVKAWGYSYTADVQNGTTARTAERWDYLGLEYDATAETWASMLQIAGSKKVIGHIVPTAIAARSAVTKGARALQVSGVRAVSPAY